jgi:hypothetical protein
MGLRLGVGGIGALLLIGPFGNPVPDLVSDPGRGRPLASRSLSGDTPQEVVDTIPLVVEFSLDGDLAEWRSRVPGQVLPATVVTPQTLVWLGQVPAGVVVAAEVRGAARARPDPARFSIELSDADPPVLPPIGWGHQFGFETLDEEAECWQMDLGDDGGDICVPWFRAQVAHREALQPLLARRWSVSVEDPDGMREDLAHPAFEGLAPGIREKLAPLEPVGSPTARSRPIAGAEAALGLEILIPWDAFPPVRPLDLEAVILGVGWDAGTGSRSGDGDPARRRMLAAPLRHRLTACGYGLREIALFDRPEVSVRLPSEHAALFMIPDRSLELHRLIVIDNEAHGYQYEPDSTMLSPAVFEADYSSIGLGEDESLCTPFLTYRKGERVSEAAARTGTGEGSPWEFLVDSRHLETRQLEDGDWLVKQGPRVWWSYYGSGQCGACPRAGIDLFHVEVATGRLTPALSVVTVASGDGNDIEIDLSDDWLEVAVYRSMTDWEIEPPTTTWKVTRYCFQEGDDPGLTGDEPPGAADPPTADDAPRYEVCGEEEPVPEPPKRLRLRYGEMFEP